MKDSKRAKNIIKTLSTLLQEFEGAQICPNVVFMTYKDFDLIKTNLPYLIVDDYLIYNKKKLQIIFTAQKSTIGLALSFHTDFVDEELNDSHKIS